MSISRRRANPAARQSHVEADERVKTVEVTDSVLSVDLMDGRKIVVPIAWFPRLLDASAAERSNWRIVGAGYGLHWPDLDEDLSIAGLLKVSRPA
jgi:hypothetical protein